MTSRLTVRLGRILCAIAVGMPVGGAVWAQKDADRELATARDEWHEGTPAQRIRSLERLEALGGDAAPAVPMLRGALNDPDPRIRAQAAQLLGQIGSAGKPSIPALIALLDDPEPGAREA